jgi:hypothetical protein
MRTSNMAMKRRRTAMMLCCVGCLTGCGVACVCFLGVDWRTTWGNTTESDEVCKTCRFVPRFQG